MPVFTPKIKKINAFESVAVLTNKDIYDKLGSRVPKQTESGGMAMFGLSKVSAAALGERLTIQSLNEELMQTEKATKETAEASKTTEETPEVTKPEKTSETA